MAENRNSQQLFVELFLVEFQRYLQNNLGVHEATANALAS
jgi:hypothetical protein